MIIGPMKRLQLCKTLSPKNHSPNILSNVLSSVLLLLFVCINLTQNKVIEVQRCGNHIYNLSAPSAYDSTLLEVRLEPCDHEPCALKRGTSGKIEIDFIADRDYRSIDAQVTAKLLGVNVKLPMIHHKTCNGKYGFVCPLIKSQNYTFKYHYHIAKLTPRLTTQLKWKLTQNSGSDTDADGTKTLKEVNHDNRADVENASNDVLCFTMIVKIV